MRACLAAACFLAVAAPVAAQRPTISPTITRSVDAATRPDSMHVWLFARPGQTLDEISALVRRSGGSVRTRSEWLSAVSATLPTEALRTARDDFPVAHMQRVGFLTRSPEPGTPILPGARPSLLIPDYGPSAMPLRVLNALPLTTVHNLTAAGVRIAMLDTGFETLHPAFSATTIVDRWDFVFNDSIVRNQPIDVINQSAHGTSTWSLLAANLPGQIIGLAPDAGYLLAKTEDVRTETRTEEDNFVAALEWAADREADIITASLGYLSFDDGFNYTRDQLNGDVAVTTVAVDSAVARGVVVVVSAGNGGPLGQTLSTPADADSVITVGAVDSLGIVAGFSSRGPTADGRIKPDVAAPGVDVFVVSTLAPSGFARQNGTSFAAPLIAGVIALMKQASAAMSPVQFRNALRMTGSRAFAPDNDAGWGIPNAYVSSVFPRGIEVTSPVSDTLQSVTPTLSWDHRSVPRFALPVTTRFVVGSDVNLSSVLIDTAVTGGSFMITDPLQPGVRLAVQIEATAADSLTVVRQPDREYVVPPWVTLLNLDDPSGLSIRDDRPTFRWSSPSIASPPGPFSYTFRLRKVEGDALVLERTGISTTSFTPESAFERNTPYTWSVEALAGGLGSTVFSRGSFVIIDDAAPFSTLLFQNFPNPFPNRSQGELKTCFWFDLAERGPVTLDILDIRGHRIRNLVPGDAFPSMLEAGRYGRPSSVDPSRCDPRLEWDGSTADGRRLPRGVYIAHLKTRTQSLFKRIVYLGF